MRVCLVTLLIVCSCSKAQEPTPSGNASAESSKVVAWDADAPTTTASDYINIKKPPPRVGVLATLNSSDGGAFASITGTSDFSSSGGVFVTRVETRDPNDATRFKSVMEKELASLQPCLNDRRLALLWPSEVELQVDASGRASSFVLPKGQEVPCLTQWLASLDLGSPMGGKRIKVKVILLVARE